MSTSNGTTSSQTIVIVKWGKETITMKLDLHIVGVTGLKQEIYETTNVPVSRQKLMCKAPKNLWKGILKDDYDFKSTISSTTELHLLLMGSAEDQQLKGPTKSTIFIEDLKSEDAAAMQIAEPAGLVNLGNTCYLNSVVQCLRAIPQFQNTLQAYSSRNSSSSSGGSGRSDGGGSTVPAMLTLALTETYGQLSKQVTPVSPYGLVQLVKLAFPQFAQTGPHGHPLQQDAEEFYSHLLTTLSNQLTSPPTLAAATAGTTTTAATTSTTTTTTDQSLVSARNAIDALFGMRLKETLTCDELSSTGTEATDVDNNALMEPPVISYDLHRKLVCNIQGGSDGNNITVNHVNEGILLGLSGKIEKQSMILGRNAMWTRTQRIAQLPQIMVIQFGRFYWKATPDSQDHQGVKCKVMKPVAFNDVLDVYDFCTPEIQTILQTARTKARQAEDDAIQRKLEGKDNDDNNNDATMKEAGAEDTATTSMDIGGEEEEDDDLKAALAMSMESSSAAAAAEDSTTAETTTLGPGFPVDFQGQYELFAVVTHKGRDADGGHYMAWVKSNHQSSSSGDDDNETTSKKKNKGPKKIADTNMLNEDWFVFDDDEVSPCKTEDVLKLKGGGDWHMSYLNFYRIKK